jgi:hypothetical protein
MSLGSDDSEHFSAPTEIRPYRTDSVSRPKRLKPFTGTPFGSHDATQFLVIKKHNLLDNTCLLRRCKPGTIVTLGCAIK